MINNDRIVPITALDLISMYGLILKLAASTAPDALDAADTEETSPSPPTARPIWQASP